MLDLIPGTSVRSSSMLYFDAWDAPFTLNIYDYIHLAS